MKPKIMGLMLVLLLAVSSAWAQKQSGTITGTVVDP
jgi:hypothetical protein